MPALLCACPRCYGKRYESPADWLADHQGIELLSTEVHITSARLPAPELPTCMAFVGTMQEDEHEMSVLVNVYPHDDSAELSFRRYSWETWDVPTRLELT